MVLSKNEIRFKPIAGGFEVQLPPGRWPGETLPFLGRLCDPIPVCCADRFPCLSWVPKLQPSRKGNRSWYGFSSAILWAPGAVRAASRVADGSCSGCSTACPIQAAFDWEHTSYPSAELICAADPGLFLVLLLFLLLLHDVNMISVAAWLQQFASCLPCKLSSSCSASWPLSWSI